jgi:dihydropyrimidinase
MTSGDRSRPSRLLIRGGTLVDLAGVRRGDVLVDGERIAGVGPDLEAADAESVDASGALVIPGGIDVHTHLDLPVGAVRSADDFQTGTVAAACGGTTCVVDFAGAGREPPEEALRTWRVRAERAVVDYGLHVTVTAVPEAPAAARALFGGVVRAGVASVKLYLAYPERLMVDQATLGRALAAGRDEGVLVCVHAEDGLEVERRTAGLIAAGRDGPSALPDARPPEVEAAAIRGAADLALEAGAALYVVHLSSASGLAEVRSARSRGAHVLAETCPQYLFLTRDRLEGPPPEAANHVCVPPLRTPADREALWAALGDGTVQVAATDHCPFTVADRRRGTAGRGRGWSDFTEIPGGLPGVETRLSLTYQGVREGRLSLERWVDAVAGAPARLFGMDHRKGALTPGLDADIVVFDPAATRRLDAHRLHSRSDHSPYEGMEVTGWAALTLARGRAVARAGEPADAEPGWGRFVPRRPVRPER